MSKAANLAKNTAILALGRASTQISAFLLLPVYTKLLSPSEYGLIDLTLTYAALLIPTLTLQIEMATFRYLVDSRASRTRTNSVVSNSIIAIALTALPWVITFAIIGSVISYPHTLSTIALIVSILTTNILLQISRGLGSNSIYATACLLTGVATLVGTLTLIPLNAFNIDTALLIISFSNVLAAILLAWKVKIYNLFSINLSDTRTQRELLTYSTPLIPNGIAWWVIGASDRTIIATLFNIASSGIYAVSMKYSSILTNLFSVFSMSWTESAAMYIDSPDRDQFFSRVANSAVRLFGALGLGLIATMPFIFPLMVDDSFKEAYLYIPIMVIGVFFNVIVGIYSAIYIAKKLTKQVMNTSLVAAALNIALTIGLIPFFGLYAAAASTAIAFLVMAIYRHYDVKKYVEITYKKNMFIILAILYAIVMYFYYLNTIWASVAALSVATISAYWINRAEVRSLKNMLLSRGR